MLRQLARLTRPIPAAGPRALAVAVYAGADGRPIPAAESGIEGVACVDDAARLLEVLCQVWEQRPDDRVRAWALGLMDFVLWMQEPDGRWVNFVYDWEGRRNVHGLTSSVGDNFWHGRAMCGLAAAWLTFGEDRAETAMHRGLAQLTATEAPSDVRTLHVQLGLRLLTDAGRADLEPALRLWTDEIAACRQGDVLMNNPDERGEPHLWAHIQEGILAAAGELLGEPGLVQIATASAHAFLAPAVRGAFDMPTSTAYGVASSIYSLDRLASVTHEEVWTELATDARAWFFGRNAAGVPIYDRETGRVADGIDDGRVNSNSGAESNIEAASALSREAAASVAALGDQFPEP